MPVTISDQFTWQPHEEGPIMIAQLSWAIIGDIIADPGEVSGHLWRNQFTRVTLGPGQQVCPSWDTKDRTWPERFHI